jgi:hypothetical protein
MILSLRFIKRKKIPEGWADGQNFNPRNYPYWSPFFL